MTEPSKPSDITRLLYKAVKSLPEDEQAAVFQYFFERGIGGPLQVGPLQAAVREALGSRLCPADATFGATTTVVRAHKSSGPPQQVIPVRLSEETHRRLKQWSADHDFHMSVVVRGLVERFLDGWQEPPAGA